MFFKKNNVPEPQRHRQVSHRTRISSSTVLLILIFMIGLFSSGCGAVEDLISDLTNQKPTFNKNLDQLPIGESLEGFTLMDKIYSQDYQADVYLFAHQKNGGQVVYVASDDQNKWFNISFKTPAVDNTGVNHILEHTVLEGSQKYRVKSPFTEISKRSVSTFMNAFTGADVTSYPFASENQKDYDNLMAVYLDAVFAPLVVDNATLLSQEGWRFEEDPQTKGLVLNGVVLNEMQGALSNQYDYIYTEIPQALYPDTKYRFNSAGNPEAIIDLTHDHLVATYHKYYAPSNACVFFYGALEIQDKLAYLNENYYDQIEPLAEIEDFAFQEPFDKPRESLSTYPSSEDATPGNDSILAWSVAVNTSDQEQIMGLEMFAELFAIGQEATLFEATVDQGYGESLYSYFDTAYTQPMLQILLEGTSDGEMAAFDRAVVLSLEKVVADGFDKEKIAAVLNQYELSFKMALTQADRGQNALNFVENGFIAHKSPLMALNQLNHLKTIKGRIEAGGYFENLAKDYLLNNNHVSKIVFTPDPKQNANQKKQLHEKGQKLLSAMSQEQVAAVKKKIADYQAYQGEPLDQQELAKLPSLTRDDLDLTYPESDFKDKEISGVRVITHKVASNGLTQIALYFDLSQLDQKAHQYLPLFTALMSDVDTTLTKNDQLMDDLNRVSNGVAFETIYKQDINDPLKVYPVLRVSSVCLNQNSEFVLQKMTELLTKPVLDQKEIVENALIQLTVELRYTLSSEEDTIASSKLRASLSAAGVMEDLRYTAGFKTLSEDEIQFESHYPVILENLNSISKLVLNQEGLTVSLGADAAGLKLARKALEPLLLMFPNAFPAEEGVVRGWNPVPKKENLGIAVASEMNSVQLGFNVQSFGKILEGQDFVFAQLLNDGYMYEKIRLKGGAYGGYTYITQTGDMVFTTHRDPNLGASVATIKGIADYVRSISWSDQEIENAVVSVAGRLFQGDDVFRNVDGDVYYLMMPESSGGPSFEVLLDGIFRTSDGEKGRFINKITKGLAESSLVVVGAEATLIQEKQLFDRIIKPLEDLK